MSDIDWTAKATLHQRDDSGSDMSVAFDEIGKGTLAAMVRRVAAMPTEERARIVLDVSGTGMLDVRQVMELSRRDDLPRT